ncbi:MAG: ferric reductase-like transmembrane domain-containing protein [Bacteroidota bacterium]|nr:ferric reductase-like transmembrane domain-containing protein [Bacteroidota bacterium]
MFTITFLDLSAGMGLCATGLLTLNILIGMVLSTAYKRSVYWKKLPPKLREISMDDLHNWTAYLALFFVCLHPLFLLLDSGNQFSFRDIFWPLQAPKQPNMVLLGTLSFYALLIVIISSQKIIKQNISFRFWKNIHLISYGTALLFLIHGLQMDPELKDRPTDYLDAEKFFSEACILIVLIASFIRYRYHLQSQNKNRK